MITLISPRAAYSWKSDSRQHCSPPPKCCV